MIADMTVTVWESSFLLALFLVLVAIFYGVVRYLSTGKKSHRKSALFLSDKKILTKTRVIVAKLYGIYLKVMNDYYQLIVPLHTGNINDYVSLFLVVAAVIITMLMFGV